MVSVVNDRPLCVVTVVTEGLLWRWGGGTPWQPAGPSSPASIWHNSWRRRSPRRKLCSANKIPMIILLHSFLRDYHFAGNWSDVFTARQSSLCLLFVKYCTTALPTDSSQLYFGGISLLSSPPFPKRRGKGGLRDSSGTSWISALSSLSPPDPLPLLPPWPDSSARGGGETWICFTLNGPLMCSKYSGEDAEMRRRWKRFIFSSGFHSDGLSESLSGLIALTVWSGIDFWHCNTTIQKTAICSLIKPRWEMVIYRELWWTVAVIMTRSIDNLFINSSYLVFKTSQVPRALGYIFKLLPTVQLWENWHIQDTANSSQIKTG